jgi:hypothetical protein
MANFNLDDYVPVQDRINEFWEDYPDGRIATQIVHLEGNDIVFKAEIYAHRDDETPMASGFAHEIRGDGYVNKTSHVENAETSAIGRCIVNKAYATSHKDRASREEMEKVKRLGQAPERRERC